MNHIHLMMQYHDDLVHLKMVQTWIDSARSTHRDEKVLEALDEREVEIHRWETQIYDEMFAISRNN